MEYNSMETIKNEKYITDKKNCVPIYDNSNNNIIKKLINDTLSNGCL